MHTYAYCLLPTLLSHCNPTYEQSRFLLKAMDLKTFSVPDSTTCSDKKFHTPQMEQQTKGQKLVTFWSEKV